MNFLYKSPLLNISFHEVSSAFFLRGLAAKPKGPPPKKKKKNKYAVTKPQKADVPWIKTFLIYRYDPSNPMVQPTVKPYKLDLREIKVGPMILTVLLMIKANQDPSITFRRSCREGICGSCAMNINGLNSLACITPIDFNLSRTTKIYPLPHMYVIKDLVVNMEHFFKQYKSIRPWLMRSKTEFRISVVSRFLAALATKMINYKIIELRSHLSRTISPPIPNPPPPAKN